MGKILVFLRPSGAEIMNGAQHFGHVGWAFEIAPNTFSAGSVENKSGNPSQPAGQNDFWAKQTSDAFQLFAFGPLGDSTRYDLYKEMFVSVPNVDAANKMVQWVSEQDYQWNGANCMNFTYEVLRAYGATFLPDPSSINNWTPNAWFNNLSANSVLLMNAKYPIDIRLFADDNCQGAVYSIFQNQPVSLPNLFDHNWNDQISSVVVRSGNLTCYQDVNYGGSELTFEPGSYEMSLSKRGWNDTISSIKATP